MLEAWNWVLLIVEYKVVWRSLSGAQVRAWLGPLVPSILETQAYKVLGPALLCHLLRGDFWAPPKNTHIFSSHLPLCLVRACLPFVSESPGSYPG